MSLNATVRWVVCYDIRDTSRGLRVLRFMQSQGMPLQYSVFIVEASAAHMHRLMIELEVLIAPAVAIMPQAIPPPSMSKDHTIF